LRPDSPTEYISLLSKRNYAIRHRHDRLPARARIRRVRPAVQPGRLVLQLRQCADRHVQCVSRITRSTSCRGVLRYRLAGLDPRVVGSCALRRPKRNVCNALQITESCCENSETSMEHDRAPVGRAGRCADYPCLINSPCTRRKPSREPEAPGTVLTHMRVDDFSSLPSCPRSSHWPLLFRDSKLGDRACAPRDWNHFNQSCFETKTITTYQ